MTANTTLQSTRQHLFSLALSALVTAGVLAGLLGLAGADAAQQANQAAATVLVQPGA